jgi:hypothetical protein
MEQPADFKRMVMQLPHSANDYASVAFTAELAGLLGLDLVGVFVEDESLADLAALPCVRELRLFGSGWHSLDATQLERVSSQAAVDARHLFAQAAKMLNVATRFDLVKGSIDEAIGSQSSADDIIVVIEPKNPAERVTHQFRQLLDVAFNAPAAVLLVPSRIRRRTGPIVAVADSARDTSVHAAIELATSVKERLIVLTPPEFDELEMARAAEGSGVAVDRRSLLGKSTGAPELAALLSRINQQFLVLSKGGADLRLPPQLASWLGVPVLVTEMER